MKSTIFIAAFIFAAIAQAGLLNLVPGEKTMNDVTLNKSATISSSKDSMSLLGAGLRSKKVLFVKKDVYVAELFASNAGKFSRQADQALASLENSNSVAIRMTFLMTVDAPTVASSYRDALSANEANLGTGEMITFLNYVEQGGDAVKGKSLVISLETKADGSVVASYEDTNGAVHHLAADRKFRHDILSIWLGVSADAGLENLKNSLLNPVY